MKKPVRLALVAAVFTAMLSCNRAPRLSDEAYREAVALFYTSLAALQTSQDVMARRDLERLLQIAPAEPAGWANLGLLLLRQQQLDEAGARLAKAAELAPGNAHVERLVALLESQRGDPAASIRHWRRAASLDPGDAKAPFALAQELERQGGGEEEAQRLYGALVDRSGNLAVLLEYARLSAKRGDAGSLRKALDALGARAPGWAPDAQARLQAVRGAAAQNPASATTPVIFLKNVLIRSPEYRSALADVSAPRSEVGEPFVRFVTLQNPPPQPAPPDEQLTFAVAAPGSTAGDGSWAGPVWLTGEGTPAIVVAGTRGVRVGAGPAAPFPLGATAGPGPDSVVAADLNYDFRTDLTLAGGGGLALLRQQEEGGFADVTAAAKLPAAFVARPLHGAWPADVDTDGDLDLVVAAVDGAPALLRNNGDGTFEVRPVFGGVERMRGFAWADLDGEGVPDAVVVDAQGGMRVFLNLRGGLFRERPLPAGVPRVAAVVAADVNGDGTFDAVGVTPSGAIVRLSQSANGAGWDWAEIAKIDAPPALGPGMATLLAADVDNNGASDLIVSSGGASRVALGGPGGTYRMLPAAVALDATAAADVDGDGRLELVGTAGGSARVARSRGSTRYHWQVFRPRAATATGDQRINSFGIGGEIEVRTGLHAQKNTIGSPVVHFGLGDAANAEVARITWPNGVLQSEFGLRADAAVAASQRLKGSCPWLFAWNGREMRFVTDFIWRSPLGLRINAQDAADVLMTEDRVRIRGDQLAPANGAYDLRITAELWETHFFDAVSLLAVDHPAGSEVFVDERFAVPPPRPAVVAVSTVSELAAVRDDRGNDVSDIVRARDDRHLDFAGRGAYQGVTRDHYVEIDLPAGAPRTGPLWLVAQGWVHPTDSSVNVAIGQGEHPRPAGLSLHVADARGRFRLVRSGLGFPAGKDKTVLVDLTGVFPREGARRLRLSTNLEIFWDRLAWAAGSADSRVVSRRIPLGSADLRFRGFSVTEQKDASTPERPRYELAGTAPRWRDLEGFHTRFGDVLELLQAVDDRYVIMNAGDELRLTFPEAPPPPPGMVRDFVLIGDGWEKDGDYNTTASRTVLPLPTHRSPRYVEGNGRLEDDPVYRRHQGDFERYHTRYVSPDPVRGALRVRIAQNQQ
jgi:hypothetical protein